MRTKFKLHVFLGVILLFALSLSIIGQVDTIRNKDGTIMEIGEKVDGQKQGTWTTYYKNGRVESEGFYDIGIKVGKWIWYHESGVLCSKEKYENGNFIKGKFWDKEGNRSDISEIMIKPGYPGGMDAFRQMIAENLKYPKEAQQKRNSGRVFVQFNINKEGELVDAKIVKGVDPYLDREALRVISLSGKWTPGTFHGERVKVSFTFPVVFILQ